jgi:hypothetical protein
MATVEATDTRTGAKRHVPEHWIGHPKLGPHLIRGHHEVPAPTAGDAPEEPADGEPAADHVPPGPGREKSKAPRAGDQKED